jgi:hypothetical protein
MGVLVLALGYTPKSEFPLTHGQDYVVYGMFLWGEVLHYLVVGDGLRWPEWLPACLFQATNVRLPRSWRFTSNRDTSRIHGSLIWGYPELVAPDAKHDYGLVEREPEALLLLERLRTELEAEDARCGRWETLKKPTE